MTSEKFQILSKNDFGMYWSAQISPLMASLLAECYTKDIEKRYNVGFEEVIVFSNGSKCTCYLSHADRKKFAGYVINKFVKNLKELCNIIKVKANQLLDFCEKVKASPSRDNYYKFKEMFLDYNFYHIVPRHLADFLEPEILKPYLQELSDIRIYVEKLHYQLDIFLLETLSNLFNINKDNVLKHTFQEIESALLNNDNLSDSFMKEFTDFCIISKKESFEKINNEKAKEIYSELNKVVDTSELKGTIAFGGKIIGRAKIVLDPSRTNNFNAGDILVTEMTRPEYVHLINKSSAVITDGGGTLCHAAIVARELKKPCIIGTKIATKILKDGDLVEVDADSGIIKIIKKEG